MVYSFSENLVVKTDPDPTPCWGNKKETRGGLSLFVKLWEGFTKAMVFELALPKEESCPWKEEGVEAGHSTG